MDVVVTNGDATFSVLLGLGAGAFAEALPFTVGNDPSDFAIADVDDETVVRNIIRLARTEGIFGETAGGVTLGVTARLIAEGDLDPDAETVIINSGDGLKTLDAVAGEVGPTATIAPSYGAFAKTGLA